MKTSAENQVADHWREVWRNSSYKIDTGFIGRMLRQRIVKVGGLSDTRFIFNSIVKKEIKNISGLKMLDAGSGPGLNSIYLAKLGAKVSLLDIAPEALDIAKQYFDEMNLKADYVVGSIFSMPFADESFDVVWNTGVLEHFEPELRKKAFSEMFRVLKKGGKILTLNPYLHAPIYLKMKALADSKGQWQAGVEYPLATLKDMVSEPCDIREYSKGFLMQYHFYKYAFPKRFRFFWIVVHEVASNFLNKLNHFSGYLLVTVVKK